jgi:glycosyltransferase involved in cell wall biosynthesis
MNILFIPSWFPRDPGDIYGSFFREQAIALVRAGHRVIVLDASFTLWKRMFASGFWRIERRTDEGLEIFARQIPSFGFAKMPRLGTFLYRHNLRRLYRKLEKTISPLALNLVHAHSYFPAGIAACGLGKKLHLPVVITEHRGTVLHDNLRPGYTDMLTACVKQAAAFVCVSGALRGQVAKITGTKKDLYVIPNMVSGLFYPAKYEAGGAGDAFRFFSVGGLTETKRFALLIRAFAACFAGDPGVTLEIGGVGPLKQSLEELIKTLGMRQQIKLLGKLPREAVADKMRRCDAFVLLSAHETFGIVYAEALACGKPVIAARNGGANEIVLPENGILIDVDDIHQAEEALKSMRCREKTYESAAIAAHSFALYSEEAVSARLTALYNAVRQGASQKSKADGE